MSTLVTALLLSAIVAAGPAALEVRISPAEVHVGDHVSLEISARAFGGAEIRIGSLPGAEDGLVEDERLLSTDILFQQQKSEEKQNLLGMLVARQTYTAIPFSVGEHKIPQVPVKVIMRDGSEIDLITPPVFVTVLSVAPKPVGPDKIAAIKGLLHHQAATERQFPWLWVIAGIMLIAAGATAVIALNRRTPAGVRKLLRLSPAERALQELDHLAGSSLLTDGKVKEFYSELSEILRRYLGLRFRVTALEMTTSELCAALREPLKIFDYSLPKLPALLQTADLVKFAKLEPQAETGMESIDAAREMVMITRDDVVACQQRRAA
jgi:hypothetical protein